MSVIWLDEPQAMDGSEVGGKAATIARMSTLGFPTPQGFVVPATALRVFLEENSLHDELTALSEKDARQLPSTFAALQEAVEQAVWPAGLRIEIIAAYEKLGGLVAVRSSGIVEDSAVSSFAGAFTSFLNCSGPNAVLKAVSDCWRSAFSPRVVAYRLEHQLMTASWMMGVIVQRMVAADKAGVMFTRNPFNSENTVLIEAVAGGCEQIVSGQPADLSLQIDRDTRAIVIEERAAHAPSHFGTGGGGILNAPRQIQPRLLRKNEIDSLVALGLRLEDAFQSAQDVEWAISGGKLSVLQARPLTAYHQATPLRSGS